MHVACQPATAFAVSNHGICGKLLDNVFDESRKFFAKPFEKKMELLVGAHAHGPGVKSGVPRMPLRGDSSLVAAALE